MQDYHQVLGELWNIRDLRQFPYPRRQVVLHTLLSQTPRRLLQLPEKTQLLLLVAAAEPIGDAGLFLGAAAQLGVSVDALAPAEADGLIVFGPGSE